MSYFNLGNIQQSKYGTSLRDNTSLLQHFRRAFRFLHHSGSGSTSIPPSEKCVNSPSWRKWAFFDRKVHTCHHPSLCHSCKLGKSYCCFAWVPFPVLLRYCHDCVFWGFQTGCNTTKLELTLRQPNYYPSPLHWCLLLSTSSPAILFPPFLVVCGGGFHLPRCLCQLALDCGWAPVKTRCPWEVYGLSNTRHTYIEENWSYDRPILISHSAKKATTRTERHGRERGVECPPQPPP